MVMENKSSLSDLLRRLVAIEDEMDDIIASPEEFEAALDELQTSISDKMKDYLRVIRRLEVRYNNLTEEIDRLAERKRETKERIDELKNTVVSAMRMANTKRIECDFDTVSLRKTAPTVIVDDENCIPEALMVVRTPKPPLPVLDKRAAKKWLEENPLEEWGHLEPGFTLSIK